MGKEKIILDTNVIVSAFGWRGKARDLLRLIIQGDYDLFISTKQLVEIQRVLDYPKFAFTGEQKMRFINLLYNIANIVESSVRVDAIKEDPSDNIFLELAVEICADKIISGDKHLLRLDSCGATKIITVKEFVDTKKL